MKLQRTRQGLPAIPIASFGDIAFLLIIFFMLASHFVKEANIHAQPPESADIERLKDAAAVSVTVDQDGVIYVDGEACPAAAVEGYVSAALEGTKRKLVRVNVDRYVTEAQFGPVLKAVARSGGTLQLVGKIAEARR
jgi:biopolymer transport protein ExbD